MTYNIQTSSYPDKVIKVIQKAEVDKFDVIALQEIQEVEGQKFIGERLEEILGNEYGFFYFLSQKKEKEHSHVGLFIAYKKSNLVSLKVKHIDLPILGKMNLFDKVLKDLFGFYGKPERKALSIDFQLGDKLLRFTTLHLDWQGGWKQREKQIQFLLKEFSSFSKADYEILCGDFNTFNLLRNKKDTSKLKILLNHYEEATKNILWTYDIHNVITPEKENSLLSHIIKIFNIHIYQKLDYIWFKGFESVSAERLHLEGSDHFPISVTLKFQNYLIK